MILVLSLKPFIYSEILAITLCVEFNVSSFREVIDIEECNVVFFVIYI